VRLRWRGARWRGGISGRVGGQAFTVLPQGPPAGRAPRLLRRDVLVPVQDVVGVVARFEGLQTGE
jgi:hypothetical protein